MFRLLKSLSAAALLVAPASVAAPATQQGSAFAFTFTAIDGKPMPLQQFSGKVLLVVNTASFCGFTKQYDGLQQLSESYGPRGLVVIGVPSNDFGEQEPKAEGEIAEFCRGAFGVTFPLTDKQVVKGDAAHPFYRWAVATLGERAAPRWNFHKYLVGRDGRLISAFGTTVNPGDPSLVAAIEAGLAAPAAPR
jgi:glutathione peroxidase